MIQPRSSSADGLFLTRVAGGNRDGTAGRRQRRVDPARHGGTSVVRVSVGAEAHVDRHRQLQLLAKSQQIVHGVGDSARVVERQTLVLIRLRQRDEDAGNLRAAADAAIASGNAGDVRAMRSFGALRLPLDVGRRQAEAGRGGNRPIQVGRLELGAVLELLVEDTDPDRVAKAARRRPGPRSGRSASCRFHRENPNG